MINIILVYCKEKVASNLKEKYFLGFFPQNLKKLTQKLILNLINFENANLRYQTLCFLQILHFNYNLAYKIVLKEKLESDYICHEILKEPYHFLLNPNFRS